MNFIIDPDYHNTRLDRFIRNRYREIALAGIFGLIRKGRIRVNGRKRKPNYRLQEGDTVEVNIAAPPSPQKAQVLLSPDERKMVAACIVYEDEDILLCNKPPGLVMHRGSGHAYGLAEMVQSYVSNPHFTFVNRIDKATSGLVIGSKNIKTSRRLSELFWNQAIAKYYAIVVEGLVAEDQFTLTSYLKKEDDRVREHENVQDGGKKSVSFFSVAQRQDETTLLDARLLTGRTHQLRVQLARRNHPIVGDGKYGHGGSGPMLLFSRRVVIGEFNLDVTLPLPDYFNLRNWKNGKLTAP